MNCLKEFKIDIKQVAKEVRQIKKETNKPCYDAYGNRVKRIKLVDNFHCNKEG